MKYWKQFLVLFLIVLFALVLLYGMSEGLYLLFILPIFAVGIFITFYLSKEFEKETKSQLKQGMKYAQEDIQAEKWVEESLTPDTLAYIKMRRWLIIIYCTIFFLIGAFVWGYLEGGLITALKTLTYMGLLFWFFIMYVLLTPTIYDTFQKLLPKRLHKILSGDWQRGYTFLFPITYLLYLLYPFESLASQLGTKLLHFPLFFVVYSFSFLCIYCIVYFYQDMRVEEEKRLKKEMKELIATQKED